MAKPSFLFDGRNLLDPVAMAEIGFVFKSIGTEQKTLKEISFITAKAV